MEGVSILIKELGIVGVLVIAFCSDPTYCQAPNASAIEIGMYTYYYKRIVALRLIAFKL